MSPQSELMIKGAGIRESCEFIAARFGEDTLRDLVDALPPDLRWIWPEPRFGAWYPARFAGALWTALACEVIGPDPDAQGEVFRALGAHVAEENLSTVYRMMLSLVWPDALLDHTSRLGQMYFRGLNIQVEREGRARRGRIIVEGGESLSYIAPVVEGWLARAYAMVGADECVVVEANWARKRVAAKRLDFTVRWD